MPERKTLADVAAAAGVSKMTASRALRGAKDVSRAKIDLVQEAARRIGYVGNDMAASLSSQRSNLLGVVVPSLSNIVFPQVMSGISAALQGTGLQPVFGVTEYSAEQEFDTLRGMLSWRPSGLIVTGTDLSEDSMQLLEAADIPIAQIMDSDGQPVDGCVGFSHVQAGRDMAAALIAAGRTRFGYVGCNLRRDRRAAKRFRGFQHGLATANRDLIADRQSNELSSVALGRQLTAELLDLHPDLDCIYYSNDDLAVGGLSQCWDAGLKVPETIALAGFNGLDLLDGFPGRIATSRTLRRDIGQAAVRMILDRLNGDKHESGARLILQPKIDLGRLAP